MFYSKTGCCLSHCPHMAGDSDQRLYGRQSRKGSTKAKTSLHGRTVALRVIAEINQGKILDALIAATGHLRNNYQRKAPRCGGAAALANRLYWSSLAHYGIVVALALALALAVVLVAAGHHMP